MIPIDDLVNDFLAQKRIAVAGVSGHRGILRVSGALEIPETAPAEERASP